MPSKLNMAATMRGHGEQREINHEVALCSSEQPSRS